MNMKDLIRRCFGGTGRALTVTALAAAAICGCKPKDDTASKATTVGFLYVGTKDDYGYNQSHADGAVGVKAIPGVKVIEAEKVAETKDGCQQNMETMINQGDATLIFATSYGYFNPHVKEIAAKYPKITFVHAGGTLVDGDPPNIGTFFANIDELEYLCGMAAGAASKTHKIGYIAAKMIAPVVRDINAFELGAKSVNPACTVTVSVTGDWFLPNEEAAAVTNLVNQGCDVISGHVDSPKVMIQTAEHAKVYSCGYHYNCSALAPTGYLTGAEWNWTPLYVKFVNDFKAGKPMPHNYKGSLKDGSVKLSPYGSAVPVEMQKKIDDVKAQMTAGTFKMYTGPIKSNEGKLVVPEGTSFDDGDWSTGLGYLVEGVVGSLPK